ncbi:DUF4097 family beta strand repeat-containing protein [Streptomyces nitrosporeus]|uniref:DUF4097 family beta strand repeat-containing protein n=1 Tax=Streptomyces nitrosporeus TaxID=28894 RepID=UPI00167DA3A7|nr:DUF4097 family beta strand repeat-containing protein [Streptomyces nitrosporeus]GGZ19684.1 hypothetical protein GCM10010327_58530 [Streptomyces nitrosporeus]
MTTRQLVAETTGPVIIDATLLGHGGRITVQAEATCTRATLTIHTPDEQGAAADAVAKASLRQAGSRLQASVQSIGGTNTGSTTVVRSGSSVIQSFGSVTGSVTGMTIIGNGAFVTGDAPLVDILINGVRVNGGGTTVIHGSSPIEITAIVPEGSSVEGHTQSAGIECIGALLSVDADTQSGGIRTGHVSRVYAVTQSGSISVEQAAQIKARTMSGAIRLGRTDVVTAKTMSGSIKIHDFGGTAEAETMSGSIKIHATAGGGIRATSISGSITVTATEDALADDLDARAESRSGRVSIPPRGTGDISPRRRR